MHLTHWVIHRPTAFVSRSDEALPRAIAEDTAYVAGIDCATALQRPSVRLKPKQRLKQSRKQRPTARLKQRLRPSERQTRRLQPSKRQRLKDKQRPSARLQQTRKLRTRHASRRKLLLLLLRGSRMMEARQQQQRAAKMLQLAARQRTQLPKLLLHLQLLHPQ